MTLQEYVDSLPEKLQFSLAIKLTKLVLPIWDKFAENNGTTYRDTVVGLTHSVRSDLLRNTVLSVEKYNNANWLLKPVIKHAALKYLANEFSEPIVALQDADWKLPNTVLMSFYSIYNLLDAALGRQKTVFDETTIYITINQAISALESSQACTIEEIKDLVYDTNGR
jgi:hypothetical protein